MGLFIAQAEGAWKSPAYFNKTKRDDAQTLTCDDWNTYKDYIKTTTKTESNEQDIIMGCLGVTNFMRTFSKQDPSAPNRLTMPNIISHTYFDDVR